VISAKEVARIGRKKKGTNLWGRKKTKDLERGWSGGVED